MSSKKSAEMVELNVGGINYTTTLTTLNKLPHSKLCQTIKELLENNSDNSSKLDAVLYQADTNKVFIDRDGALFRFVLDFLRQPDRFILPENFYEVDRLTCEAEYYGLDGLTNILKSGKTNQISPKSPLTSTASTSKAKTPGCITVGYRGTFSFGRDGGVADVKFRKMLRILIAGRVQLCKEVFGESLNESRDPDRDEVNRYTSRFFLKHSFLEQAFDALLEAGFRMVGSCGSGTNGISDCKPGMESSEELKWLHYNEFVFMRC